MSGRIFISFSMRANTRMKQLIYRLTSYFSLSLSPLYRVHNLLMKHTDEEKKEINHLGFDHDKFEQVHCFWSVEFSPYQLMNQYEYQNED